MQPPVRVQLAFMMHSSCIVQPSLTKQNGGDVHVNNPLRSIIRIQHILPMQVDTKETHFLVCLRCQAWVWISSLSATLSPSVAMLQSACWVLQTLAPATAQSSCENIADCWTMMHRKNKESCLRRLLSQVCRRLERICTSVRYIQE